MTTKKLALVHEKLAGAIGGSESIIFAAMDLFPSAKIYSTVLDRDILPPKYKNAEINSTFLQNLPFAKKIYKAYFPIMPIAIENLNLQEYDVILSSHHCVAKGIIPRPDAIHICYCHSPARYIWDLFWAYSDLNGFGSIKRLFVSLISHHLRIWDSISAYRVDHFLANSRYTAERIRKYYNKDSEILYPPVNTKKFHYENTGDYYLMAGRLVSYKGFELGIDAFNESGKKLVIIGDGPEFKKLKEKAKSNIEMLGTVSDKLLIKYMNNCKGFIFPGKEDFGIVMVEAQSAGKPVIAYKAGGALDIVTHEKTGLLFDEQTVKSLNNAISRAESIKWEPEHISNHAAQFDIEVFKHKLKEIIDNAHKYKIQ